MIHTVEPIISNFQMPKERNVIVRKGYNCHNHPNHPNHHIHDNHENNDNHHPQPALQR